MKRGIPLLVLAGLLLPAGLALKAQDRTPGGDLDRLLEDARAALAAKAAKKTPIVFEQHVYDIRDLTQSFEDRPGRALDLMPSGGFGFGFVDAEGAEPVAFYEGEQVVDLIRENVAPGSWDELKSTSISYVNGVVVVRHTPAVHARIAAFLGELRTRAASQVTVDVAWLRLPDAALRGLLGDASAARLGADGTARIASLVESGGAKVVRRGSVQCVNTQRVNLTELRRHSYVQDYDVEIAESASIADPIVSTFEEGVVVDVRPVIAGHGDLVILEVRADVSRLAGPIAAVETPLGAIETPRLEVLRLRTTLATGVGEPVVVGGTLSDGDGSALLLVLTPTAARPGAK